MMKINNIDSKLKKKLKELAAKLPEVKENNATVNHYKKIRRAYISGGQNAVFSYCHPYMIDSAANDLKKDEATGWTRNQINKIVIT